MTNLDDSVFVAMDLVNKLRLGFAKLSNLLSSLHTNFISRHMNMMAISILPRAFELREYYSLNLNIEKKSFPIDDFGST